MLSWDLRWRIRAITKRYWGFYSTLAVQERTSTTGRLAHVIPPDQRPVPMSSLHAKQVPTVISVGRVYSNRHSRIPADTHQKHFLLLMNDTNSVSFSVNCTTGKPSVSGHLRSLCSKDSGAKMGEGKEECREDDSKLNVRLTWPAGRCHTLQSILTAKA